MIISIPPSVVVVVWEVEVEVEEDLDLELLDLDLELVFDVEELERDFVDFVEGLGVSSSKIGSIEVKLKSAAE